jgi:hypothetical protein
MKPRYRYNWNSGEWDYVFVVPFWFYQNKATNPFYLND